MPPVLHKLDAKNSTSSCQTSDNSKPEATASVTLAFVGCPSNSTEISMNFGNENTSGTARSHSAVCLKNEIEVCLSNLKDNKNPAASNLHSSPCCSRFASSIMKETDEEAQIPSSSRVGHETENVPRLPSDQSQFVGKNEKNIFNTTEAIDEIKSDGQSKREYHLPHCSETSVQIEGNELGIEDFSNKSDLKNPFVQVDVADITTEQDSSKGKRKKSSQKQQKLVDGVEHVRTVSPSRSACYHKDNVSPTTEICRRKYSLDRGIEDKPFISSSQRFRSDLRIHKNKSDGRYMDNPDGSTGGMISTENGEVKSGLKFSSDQVQRPKAQGDAESMKKGNVVRIVSPTTIKRNSNTDKSRKLHTEACFTNEDDQEQMKDRAKVKGPTQSVESIRLNRSKSKSVRDDYPSLDQMFNDVMKLLVQQSSSETDHEIPPIYDEDGRYELPEAFPLSTLQNTCQSAHLCSWDEDIPSICRSSNRSIAKTPFKEATILDSEDSSGVPILTPEEHENFGNELEYFPSKGGLLTTDNNLNCHHCYDDDLEECCQSWAFVDPEPSSGESSRGSFGSNEDINTQAEAGPQLRENGIERPCVRDMIKTLQERLSASSDTTSSKERSDKSVLLLNDTQWSDQTISTKETHSFRDQGSENDILGTRETGAYEMINETASLRDYGTENDALGTKENKASIRDEEVNVTVSVIDNGAENDGLISKEPEAFKEKETRNGIASLRDHGIENDALGTNEIKGSEVHETMTGTSTFREQETQSPKVHESINETASLENPEKENYVLATKETEASKEQRTINETVSLQDYGTENYVLITKETRASIMHGTVIETESLEDQETKAPKVHETMNETGSFRDHGKGNDVLGTKETEASKAYETTNEVARLTDQETKASKEHEGIDEAASVGYHGIENDVLGKKETETSKVQETIYEAASVRNQETKAFIEQETITETASLGLHEKGNDVLGSKETESSKGHQMINEAASLRNQETKISKVHETKNEANSLSDRETENGVLSTKEAFKIHETLQTQSVAQASGEGQLEDSGEPFMKLVNNTQTRKLIENVLESDYRSWRKENSLDQSESNITTKEMKNLRTNVTIRVTPASPLLTMTLSAISDNVSESTDDSESEEGTRLTVPEICTLPLAQHPDLILFEEREREMIEKNKKMSESSNSEDCELNRNELLEDSRKESKHKKNALLSKGIVASCFERAKDAITRARARSVSPVKALARLDDLFGKGKTMIRRVVKSWSVSDFNQINKLASDSDMEMVEFGNVKGSKTNEENSAANGHGGAGIHEFMSETLVTNGDAHPPLFCLRINESNGRKQCNQLSRCDPFRHSQSSLTRKENHQHSVQDENVCIPNHEKLGAIDDQLEEVSGSQIENCDLKQNCQIREGRFSKYENEVKDDLFLATLHDTAYQPNGVDVSSSPSNTGAAKERSPILEPIEETDSNAESGHHESNDDGLEVSEDALDAFVACGMSSSETRDKKLKEDGDAEEEIDNRTCKVHACVSCSECKRDVEDVSVHDDLSSSAPLKTFSLVYAGEAAHTESGVSDVMALISQEASIKRYPSFPDLTDLNDEEDPVLAAKESTAALQSIPDLETDVVPKDENEKASLEGQGHTNIFHSQTSSNEALTNVSFLRDESPLKPVAGQDCEKMLLENSPKVRRRTFGVNVRAIVSLLESRTASNSSGQEKALCIKAKSLPQTSLASGLLTSKVPKCALSEASESTRCLSDRSTQSAMSDTMYQMRGHEISDLNLPSPPNHSLSDESTASGHRDSIKDSHSSSNEDIELHVDGILNDQPPSKIVAKGGKNVHHTKLSRLRAALAQEYSPLTEENSTGHERTTISGASSEEKLLLEESDLSLSSQIPDSTHARGRDDSDTSSAQDNTNDLQTRNLTDTINGCHGCSFKRTRCDKEKSENKKSDILCSPTCGECDNKANTEESRPVQDVNELIAAASNEHTICPVDVSNAKNGMKEGQLKHDIVDDSRFDTRLEFIRATQRPVESPCPISSDLDSGKEELSNQSQKLDLNSRAKAEGNYDDEMDFLSHSSDHSARDKCNSCLLLDEPTKPGSKLGNPSSPGNRSATLRNQNSLDNLENENKVSETVEKTPQKNVIKSIKLTKHGVSKNNWNNNLSVTFSEVTCARVRARDTGNVKRCQSGYFNRTRNSLNPHGYRQTLDLKSMREDSCYTISSVSKIIGLPHQDECKKEEDSKRMLLRSLSSTSSLSAVSEAVAAKSKFKKSKPSSLTMCIGNKTLNITEAAKGKSLVDKPLLNKDGEGASFNDNEPFSQGSVVIQNDFVSDSITEILTPEPSNHDIAHIERDSLPERPTDSNTKTIKFEQTSADKPFSSAHPRSAFSEQPGKRDTALENTKSNRSPSNMKSGGEEPTKLSQRIYRSDTGSTRTYSFVSRSEQHIHRCDKLVAKSFETIRLSQSMISKSRKQMEEASKAMKCNKNVNKSSHWK